MNPLISGIEETLTHLQKSDSSDFSHTPVEEIISILKLEIKNGRSFY